MGFEVSVKRDPLMKDYSMNRLTNLVDFSFCIMTVCSWFSVCYNSLHITENIGLFLNFCSKHFSFIGFFTGFRHDKQGSFLNDISNPIFSKREKT